MSSAILYLAIVAIWACVLVPRWLHRSHENPSDGEILADSDETAGFEEEDAEFDESSDAPTEEFAPVSRSRAGPVAETYVAVETEYVEAEYVQGEYVHGEYVTAGYAGEAPAPPEFTGHPDLPVDSPPASRDRVLQTRRRLLTILVVLTAAAVGGTITGITMWWTIVPPAIMLGLYVVMLREAAQADAENELRRAEAEIRRAEAQAAAAEAAHAAAVARAREREALAAQAPQPSAEIIDITGRTARDRDQLYDQYADATVRAVGD